MHRLSLMDGQISAVAHLASPDRWIICSHGLYSSKDSDKYLQLAEKAAQRNISLLRFDHRGCGESSGSFADSTLTRRIEDMQAVVEWTCQEYNGPIAFFGSSFGGMVSILAADTTIRALALMSTPYIIEGDLGLTSAFMHDLKCYDLLNVITTVPPVLIMHGRHDELVPVAHARALHEHAPVEKKLMLFDADHRFSDDTVRKKSLTAAVDWIDGHL